MLQRSILTTFQRLLDGMHVDEIAGYCVDYFTDDLMQNHNHYRAFMVSGIPACKLLPRFSFDSQKTDLIHERVDFAFVYCKQKCNFHLD